MIRVEDAPRLRRLRQGFDLTIQRLYADKAAKGYPVVVTDGGQGFRYIDARTALKNYMAKRALDSNEP